MTKKICSRAKGARFERMVAKALVDIFGVPARRGQQFCGGSDSPDVIFHEGLHIEAKFTEALNLNKAFEQSKRDCGAKIPLVISKKKLKDILVTVRLDDLSLLSKIIHSITKDHSLEDRLPDHPHDAIVPENY